MRGRNPPRAPPASGRREAPDEPKGYRRCPIALIRGAQERYPPERECPARELAMAEDTPAVQCPSCGSSRVAQVPLMLIQARYYPCDGCTLTFRDPREAPRDSPPGAP